LKLRSTQNVNYTGCVKLNPDKYFVYKVPSASFNPLNAELNPICHLLALLGAHHILHVSRIRADQQKYCLNYKIVIHFKSCRANIIVRCIFAGALVYAGSGV